MINYYSFDDKIVIYWLFDHYVDDAHYTIFLNENFVGTTNKSHYEFTKLKPGKEYKITVAEHGQYFDEIIVSTKAKKKIIDVTKRPYCVDNSGNSLVTKKLQEVLDNASDKEIIYFPKGTYYTGALTIPKNREIYLARDAVIQGSDDPLDYLPMIKSRFEGTELMCYQSLINIGELDHKSSSVPKNIIIRGEGSIIGGGRKLCENIIERETPNVDESVEELPPYLVAGRRRGRLINISNSSNIIIDGLYLALAPSWNVHMIYSDHIITHNCFFESFDIHNGDGWDPDSSHDCILFNSTFRVGDDCVAIKSGKNPEGNIINRSTYNISIFDCKTITGHGCAIGSELSGGVYNVDVFDCDFTNTLYGMHIKTTKKRGGFVKNINVKNCSFSSINIHTVSYNDDGDSSNDLTEFTNFNFSKITLTGIMYLIEGKTDKCKPIVLDGFAENSKSFNNFTFNDVLILNTNNGFNVYDNIKHIENLKFSNLHLGGN